ncbi:hypothetical protein PJL18_01660 [Paenarthrobacter nicotinovorans]|nr:hypothetical protein [Paenarthrobacter nicotinovorans]
MSFAEELGTGQDLQHRVREHEHNKEVGKGRQAQGKGKATDVSDSHEVQDQRGQKVDGFGSQDRALGALPAVLDGGHQSAPVAQFVTDTFEVDDERVGGLTDSHNQTCDTCQGQPVVLGPAEDCDGKVRQQPGHYQGSDGNESQSPVLEERVDNHQQQADHAGKQAKTELVPAKGGRDLLLGLDLETDREGTVAQLVGQGLGTGLGEVAGDLRLSVGDDGKGTRC